MRIRVLAISAVLALLPLGHVSAEPQILGLVATNSAKQLNCVGGECFAEFTSFCMEPDRASPGYLTQYTAVPGSDDLQIVATTADGQSISLPASKLKFRTERGFAAVRVSLPADALSGLDVSHVSLKVGSKVALRPVPLASYRRPHEPDDVVHTATKLRAMGEKVVDQGGVPREITDLTNTLVNALPERGWIDPDRRLALWDKTFGDKELESFSSSAVRQAKRSYQRCLAAVETHTQDTLRGCIWRAHDHQVWKLNHRYWNGLSGS